MTHNQSTSAQTTQSISVRAPAKLNLYLHVTAQRADGYHEIDSLVVFTASGDTVSVQPGASGGGMRLISDGPFSADMGADGDNLVLRAARLLADHAALPRTRRDVKIHLTKRLPVAAGIGGGSSDAAATLRALTRLWDLDISEQQLAELGLSLGADVPMCLRREAVFVGGIGEQLDAAPALPPISLVLVNPRVAVATPVVFRAYGESDSEFSQPARFNEAPDDVARLADILRERRNDLSAPAIGAAPEIARVLTALKEQSGCLLARMSGSGATCFGLFADSESAEQARRSLQNTAPQWWVDAMMMF